MAASAKTLAIFFSKGAFGDCARHAILVALEDPRVSHIKVFSSYLSTLGESNWKSNSSTDHATELHDLQAKHKDKILELIPLEDVTNESEMMEKTATSLQDVDAIISGLGNRQPFLGDRVAAQGTKNVVKSMKQHGIERLVMMSSMGVNDDWPCMEWRLEGKIMTWLFRTICRREYNDLARAEQEVTTTKSVDNSSDDSLNYVIVRPVGLGEKVVPKGEYFLQKKKYEDALGPNMAKMDVGRFLVEQAVAPTISQKAVVIGADPAEAYSKFE
eukprot:CAMPEP_0195282382 /NCGR_PEP_ID=MMETSP0707-20130614/1278_1 /TAXON_ID=33640 /ORGANISM="Asterionellopsis glacialis, Strain CCMP134" /LENGTH=271 /DNA_ID=CAMNT_0040341347 /DNA_START=27 /DNA_END=842 /DNA_ORIENTATION=-